MRGESRGGARGQSTRQYASKYKGLFSILIKKSGAGGVPFAFRPGHLHSAAQSTERDPLRVTSESSADDRNQANQRAQRHHCPDGFDCTERASIVAQRVSSRMQERSALVGRLTSRCTRPPTAPRFGHGCVLAGLAVFRAGQPAGLAVG